MNIPLYIQQPASRLTSICDQQLKTVWLWIIVALVFVCGFIYVNSLSLVLDHSLAELPYIVLALGLPSVVILVIKSSQYINSKRLLADYQRMQWKLEKACSDTSLTSIQAVIFEAEKSAQTNNLISKLLQYYQPELSKQMTKLHRLSLVAALKKEHASLASTCSKKIQEIRQQVPLIKARDHISTSLDFLTARHTEMIGQWETAYESFSWWNKLKYMDGPDFSEIKKAISDLKALQSKLMIMHSDDFETLDSHFKQLEAKAIARLSASNTETRSQIRQCTYQDAANSDLLKKSLWFSAMSVPVSIWSDLDSASDVYATLREVNSNYVGMSDTEIWWDSLFLPAESLAGLTALTKGAYFENLVAEDTGGQLFEHFNNPDTDIVIDGVAFQIKATDSEGYVNSVDELIPVIATSEVAVATGAIDGGYSNEELTNTIDNALGGTVVDMGDTAADAILAGLGGLGFFATIQGINHASEKYENGGDAVEAVFEGAGVAIEGTARALVGAAELGYNVLMSRPSRFMGRTLLKGLVKLDNKLCDAPVKKSA